MAIDRASRGSREDGDAEIADQIYFRSKRGGVVLGWPARVSGVEGRSRFRCSLETICAAFETLFKSLL